MDYIPELCRDLIATLAQVQDHVGKRAIEKATKENNFQYNEFVGATAEKGSINAVVKAGGIFIPVILSYEELTMGNISWQNYLNTL